MDGADPLGFEAAAHVNGDTTWSAREFGEFLGYADYSSFRRRAVERAISACTRLGIPVAENFAQTTFIVDDRPLPDLKLTRFACYLIAMNGDPHKEMVAKSQAYFAGLAESFQEYVDAAAEVDRLVVRGEISEGETSLSATAKMHGVVNYGFFQSSGYRGMYNMPMAQLRELKRVPGTRSPLDFMHSEELAANLFRITQTEAKIRNDDIRGQQRLEQTAREVGKTVRDTMEALSGTRPEDLPPAGDIKQVEKSLKKTQRSFKKMDRRLIED